MGGELMPSNTLQILAQSLKYFGLMVGTASAVWGALLDLKEEGPGGKKRLTKAGKLSIGITIVSFVVSLSSAALVDRLAREADKEAAKKRQDESFEQFKRHQEVISGQLQELDKAENLRSEQREQFDKLTQREAKRTTDIIIAGQPLTSLTLTWAIRGLDAELVQMLKNGYDNAMDFIKDQQGERGDEQNRAVFRENQLYPFLVALSRHFTNDAAKDTNPNVAVLLALDDDHNSVLPFGFLDQMNPWLRGATGTASKYTIPPSLEIGSHSAFGNANLLNWPWLQVDNTNAIITWTLDPLTFAESLNRQNNFIVPTAKCPSVLRIAILFDITGAPPFAAGNFALAEDQDFWKFHDYPDTQNENFRGKVALITKNFSSSVRLVPNNSSLVTYNYGLNQVYESLFLDSYGEANPNLRCLVFEYKLER